MKEKIEEILEKFRNTLVKKNSNIRLADIKSNGTVSIELTGLSRICPMVQFMMQFYLDKILKKKVPGVRNVVYIINYS